MGLGKFAHYLLPTPRFQRARASKNEISVAPREHHATTGRPWQTGCRCKLYAKIEDSYLPEGHSFMWLQRVRLTDLICRMVAPLCTLLLFRRHRCSYGLGNISSADALHAVEGRAVREVVRLSGPLTTTFPGRRVPSIRGSFAQLPLCRKREK